MRITGALLALIVFTGFTVAIRSEDPPKPAEPGTLVLIDSAGKEQKLKTWKFAEGVRHLSWLAAPEKEPKKDDAKDDKKAKNKGEGPEAIEIREDNSTNWKIGVLTLVPLIRVKSIAYDIDKKTVTVHVAAEDKGEESISGTTEYPDSNRLAIEAEVDKGDMGVLEEKYIGGSPKGIRGIRFPLAKVDPAAKGGRPAVVTVADKRSKHTFKVEDVQALYRTESGEKIMGVLMFKKSFKVDMSKISKITCEMVGATSDWVWQVTLPDEEKTLTLLNKPMIDGKTLELEGLLARVKVGYKLIPLHTIQEIDFDPARVEAEDKPKDKIEKKDG